MAEGEARLHCFFLPRHEFISLFAARRSDYVSAKQQATQLRGGRYWSESPICHQQETYVQFLLMPESPRLITGKAN